VKNSQINIICCIVTVVILAFLTAQVVFQLSAEDYSLGENYYMQPVGPGMQLVVVVVAWMSLAVLAWRYFRKKDTAKRKNIFRRKKPRKQCSNHWDEPPLY